MSDKAWNTALEIMKSSNLTIELDYSLKDDDFHADYVVKYFHRLYETLKLVEDGTFSERLKEKSENQ